MEALIRRMIAGDLAARDRLLESLYGRVRWVAGGMAEAFGMRGMAEDLFQEGCLVLLEKMSQFKAGSPVVYSFLRYVFIVLRNKFIDILVRESMYTKLPGVITEEGAIDDPIEYISNPSVSDPFENVFVERFLQCCTQWQREVIELLIEGFTQGQMTERVGIRQPGISRRIDRVKKKFNGV